MLDTNETLEKLVGPIQEDNSSCLSSACWDLYRKPLRDFTAGDLRVMISQEIGLEFLVPPAVDFLERNPLLEGDLYPGDLLIAVLRVSAGFWRSHEDLY